MSEVAIVTLAIGEKHLGYWQAYCEASWRAYADKSGYDLIVVKEPLDTSSRATSRSPAWQKCLVLSQDFAARYRQIVLLDCDILINAASAPRITDQVEPMRVGGVIAGSHVHEDLRIVLLSRLRRTEYAYQASLRPWQEDQAEYYRHFCFEPQPEGIIQTGVLVASPERHRQIFEAVYEVPWASEHRSFEQIPLSHAILSQRLFQPIDTRFNSVFFETMLVHFPYLTNTQTPSYEWLATAALQAEFANNFFLHMAYIAEIVRCLPREVLLAAAKHVNPTASE